MDVRTFSVSAGLHTVCSTCGPEHQKSPLESQNETITRWTRWKGSGTMRISEKNTSQKRCLQLYRSTQFFIPFIHLKKGPPLIAIPLHRRYLLTIWTWQQAKPGELTQPEYIGIFWYNPRLKNILRWYAVLVCMACVKKVYFMYNRSNCKKLLTELHWGH